jgi:hypothetical protein
VVLARGGRGSRRCTRVPARPGGGAIGRRPQARRIRIQAEDDLRAASLDRRGQAVAERRRARQDRTAFLSDEPAVKRGTVVAAIRIGLPVRGFTPLRETLTPT